ncbi:MAG: heat shock protein HtpX [Frankiaceae bacterium]|nr:heat shock protein HtpX [Frankiaceae bacterium]
MSHHNGLKTAALLGLMSAFILVVGSRFGSGGLVIALVFALGINGFSYFYSDKLALRSMAARPVSEAEAPALYGIVAGLAQANRMPMPRLYVSPTMQPNAFATGRSPRHAAVCCTEGILRMMDERELRGVLGHELAHVMNRDILLSSVAAALATVIMFMSRMAMFASLFGGGRDNRDRGGGLESLALIILGPIAAMMMQMALSRSREFQADATGANVTGDPLALASALRKLDTATKQMPLPPDPALVTTSQLMIANPFGGRGGLSKMFSTHPPMDERIRRLEEMAGGPSY